MRVSYHITYFIATQETSRSVHVSYLAAHPVGGLQSAVVCDVLPQGVLSIQRLLVDAVVSVLLHHALGLLLEGLYGGVLPPGPQVSVLVVFSAFGVENQGFSKNNPLLAIWKSLCF